MNEKTKFLLIENFELFRTFNAIPNTVWRCWTEPELISRWYGHGVETTIHQFDPVKGGEWLSEMKRGKNTLFRKAVFTDVLKPTELSWLHYTNTNSKWECALNSRVPDWPKTLRTRITLSETNSKTDLILSCLPHNASEAEEKCFASLVDEFADDLEKSFDIMDEILQELQT